MKNKKLVLASLCIMALSLSFGCGKKEVTIAEASNEEMNSLTNIGFLAKNSKSSDELHSSIVTSVNEKFPDTKFDLLEKVKFSYYDNLTQMLLALRNNDIQVIQCLPKSTADYIAIRNDDLEVRGFSLKNSAAKDVKIFFSMGLKEDKTDLLEKLNTAINGMKADGTLNKLKTELIDKYSNSTEEPPAIEIPKIEGADTIKFAVTGDLPPMDFVSADGKPAGYNIAVLAEISKRLNVNVDTIQVDTASRAIALESGKVDVIFWINRASTDLINNGQESSNDVPKHVILTENYFEDKNVGLVVKR